MDRERREEGRDLLDMDANQNRLTKDDSYDVLPSTPAPKSQWKGTGKDFACFCEATFRCTAFFLSQYA